MKLLRWLFTCCFLVAVLIRPTQAKEITKIPRVQELDRSARTVKEWLAQIEQQNQTPQTEVVQVTGVKANPTARGVEVILQTSKGEQLQITNRSVGNNFIADIPNAQLRLPSGEAFTFRSQKPIVGVNEITVTNFDANTIRVSAIGETGVPTVELFDSADEGLIFSMATTASTAQQPQTQPTPKQQPESQTQPSLPSTQGDEPIELVVTGEQDGYSVPDSTTATKTDTPVRDIPQSIQVVPQQVIKDQQITRISDAVRNVSGVAVQGSFSNLTDNYIIRGLVTYNNLRNGFAVQDNYINPIAVDRIEVLKGPASVLYGQFEPGGIVNYVTKQPLSTPYYAGELTVGNYDFYRPSIDISGPLTPDKNALYRLNAAYENSGSFIDFVNSEGFSIAPVLSLKLSDATTLTLEYEHSTVNRTLYDGLLPIRESFQLPINRFLGEPNTSNYNYKSDAASFTLEHRFSDNLRLRSAFLTNLYHADYTAIRPDSLEDDGRTISRTFAGGLDYYKSFTLQNELVGKFKTGFINHQLLLGLELNWNLYGNDFIRTPAPGIDIFNPVYGAILPTSYNTNANDETKQNTVGVYLQDQVVLFPNLKLLVGGRWDFINYKFRELDYNNNR